MLQPYRPDVSAVFQRDNPVSQQDDAPALTLFANNADPKKRFLFSAEQWDG